METMKKIACYALIVFLSLSINSCEVQRTGCTDPAADNFDIANDIDDGSCVYSFQGCSSQSEGNLTILNTTSHKLFLWADNDYITCIPEKSDTFHIFIPNPEAYSFKLQLWKADNVDLTELNNNSAYKPDEDLVYKTWVVALSESSAIEQSALWPITGNSNEAMGTVYISYPKIDETTGNENIYQVDIYLNSKNGNKLASLRPGTEYKKFGAPYVTWRLYYRYWYSDNSTSNADVTEVSFSDEFQEVTLNSSHQVQYVVIPYVESNIGKNGNLVIHNTLSKTVTIYAENENQFIEDIVINQEIADNLSHIPANSKTSFNIPLRDGYDIWAKYNSTNALIANYSSLKLIDEKETHVYITEQTQTVNITNYLNEPLLIYNSNDEFIGYVIEANSSLEVKVPSNCTELVFKDENENNSVSKACSSEISINSLSPISVNELIPVNVWELYSPNHYKSNLKSGSGSEIMTFKVNNTDAVVLSFEYKLDIEPELDSLTFRIDNATQFNLEIPTTNNKLVSDSGNPALWNSYNTTLQPGTHELKWGFYRREDASSQPPHLAEIKNIQISPL